MIMARGVQGHLFIVHPSKLFYGMVNNSLFFELWFQVVKTIRCDDRNMYLGSHSMIGLFYKMLNNYSGSLLFIS